MEFVRCCFALPLKVSPFFLSFLTESCSNYNLSLSVFFADGEIHLKKIHSIKIKFKLEGKKAEREKKREEKADRS